MKKPNTEQIDKAIQQLEEVDAKKDPKKVVQVVNSLISIIDQGNKSETTNKGQQTKVFNALWGYLNLVFFPIPKLSQQPIRNDCEYIKITYVYCGSRNWYLIDLGSNGHYLGSGENEAWKKFQACTRFEPTTSAISV